METLIYVFGFIGVIDTLYLIYHKVRGTDFACPLFPKEWCRKVQYSKYSKIFGIPNSVAGLFMYAAIIVLIYMHVNGFIVFWPLKALITFGFLFSMYFVYIQAFVLRAFCTWCVLSAINFTVMFLSVWLLK